MEKKIIEKMNSMTNAKNRMISHILEILNYLNHHGKDIGVNSESINKNPSELTDQIQPQMKASK